MSVITDNASADELAQILRTITGTTFYDQYNNGTTNGHTALADELVSHIMQEVYATGKDAAEIAQNYGINNETILQTLNNIDYEQRQSNSLSKARRDNILGRNTQSSSRQSGGNNQTQSQGGLVQQRTRPAGKGSSGTPSRGQTAERGEIADTPVSALSFDEQAKSLKELISFHSKEEEEYFDSILPNLKADKLGVNDIPGEVILNENSIIEKLEERISDYVAEHYPTQATVSALTDTPQGKQEREAMKKDPTLAQLRKEVNEQRDEAGRKINAKYEAVKAITDKPSVTLGEVAQLWNDALEFCRSLDTENGIRFSVGNAGNNLHKSLKSSTFADRKSSVPKAELAAAYADMFRKQTQGQFADGNGYAYSANYFHFFENGRIALSIPIEGNEDYIKDYQSKHGTNSSTGTFSQGAGHLWRSQRPSVGDNGIPQRQRSRDERVDRLYGAERTDGASDNQKVNRDTQSDSQTELTDPRFSVSGTQVVPLGERTLVGLHNISSDKLRKVLKAGGVANPSAAVIDIAKQDHHGYGEISLVMPASLVDSDSGNNAGAYTGDMWLPTYPTTERRMSDKGADTYYKALNSAFGNDPARRGLWNKISLGFSNWLIGQHDPKDFAYWYMLEKGITPEDVLYNSGVPASVKQRFAPIAGKRLYEYSEEDRELLLSLIAEQRGITVEELKQEAQELRQRYQETLDDPDSKVFQRRIAQDAIEDIDTYGVKYNVLEKGIDDLQNAIKNDGKIDIDATLSKAEKQVQTDYKDDFDKWLNDFDKRFGIKEYIFDGYTRDGDRKYIPDTLANASRLMNREELQNAGSHGGFNATKGQLIERMNTLADIRANKYRLTSKEGEKDEQWEQLGNEWFNNIIDPLAKMRRISDNPFSNVDYAEQRLLEALRQKDPIAHLNKEYGYSIAKDSAFAKALNDLVQRIKDLPAKYFETKFKRPVYLNEFRNAVVPNTLPQDLRDGLQQAGLGLYEYDPKAEGSRRKATLQATEADGIRFSIGTTLATDKTLTPEARKEMQAIAEQAKADGTFMQAPNGKPSNLNERQWLQVRTRAFKNWFGDWEKSARIEKLRNSEPAVITGSEFDITDNPKKAAIEYGKKLQGYYTNKDTGVVIQLQRGRRNGGINEVLQHNYKDIPHIQSVAAIPQIIEKSTFIDSKLNNDVEKNPSVVSYDHYVCGLKIGDADYTVHALIAMDSKGNRYYDHNLVQIEKKKLLDEIQQATSNGDFGTMPDTKSTISNSDRKVTELFSILQTNSSKCVDTNGEPLVVYHGTLHPGFSVFNTLGRFRGKNSTSRNTGVYTTDDRSLAYIYTSKADYDNQNDYTFSDWDGVGQVYSLYLNIKTPLVIECNGADFDEIHVGGKKTSTDKVVRKLRRGEFGENYDGVIFKDVYDGDYTTDYVALSPDQIKSATDNNGSFSENSDDIRFSIIGERGAANLDHAEEVTTRIDNLQVARDMEKNGKDAKTIRLATGWERGADKKWRYEIPDAKVKDTLELSDKHVVKRFEEDMLWNEGKLEDTISVSELFDAYPQLKKVRLSTDNLTKDMPSNGSYSPNANTITIHASKLKYLNSILNHEIQHVIQDIEGFERGGDLDEKYIKRAGEVEARNVQSRMGLSEQQRRERLLAETEDVAPEDQIFLLGDKAESAEAQYDELDYDIDNLTDAQQLATDAVVLGGISVERVSEEQAEREVAAQKKSLDDTATWSELMVRANKAADITSNDNAKVLQKIETAKRKLETATWREDNLHTKNAADVSSLDDAKVRQKIDISKQKLENQSTKSIKNPVSFISDILELRQTGSSYYGTFKLKDGSFITLRLSNHNATVSNFDNEGETEGVSIVISAHPSKGIRNDGTAHVVEYFYRKKDLWNAYGTPLADILGDISELLRTGEYKDTTGLAQRQEVNIPAEPLRTSNGTIYGYAKDGKIYLTDRGLNPNTPIHEYTHLWVKAVRNNNAELYDNLRDLFSRENLPDMWDELDNDPQYRDLSDEAKLSEIIARFSGKRGAERMEQEAQKLIDDAKQQGKRAVADAVSFREHMRNLLRRFWNWVGEHLFHIKNFGSREEAADRVLYDLLNGTDLGQTHTENDSRAEFSTSPMPKRIEGEMVHEWARRIAEWKRQQVDEQQVAEYAKLLKQNDSKKSKLFAQIVDKFTPIDNFQQWVQAQGGVYDEDTMDMHSDISLALGRIETFSRRYKNDYMQRIADSIAQIAKDNRIAAQLLALGLKWQNFDNKNMNGKPLTVREIMGVYAQAKDTREAEQQGLSDRGAQGFVKNLGASHTDIIEAVERIIPQKQLDEFWNAVYAANQFALDYQLNAGMIDSGTRNLYTRRYYVPQRGWRERDFDGIDNAYVKDNGTRLYGNPYNAALVKAHGRESLASDPFALIESIGLTSIIQSEHNKSKQQLLNLLLANEMLGLKSGAWRVKQVWSKNVINPRTGHIMRKPDGTPVQAEVTYAAPTQQEREHDADINDSIDQLRKELRDLTQPAACAKRETEIASLQDQLIYTGRATDTMLEHRTRDERLQHQIIVLHDGQQYVIELQDERLANAVNGNFGEAIKAYALFNKYNAPAIRYISGVLTQYNPRFAHRNFWRDAQAAFLNNLSEQGVAFTTRAMANIPMVQRTVWKYILADTYKGKEKYTGQFGDYLREYFEAGAQTGFSFMPELERMAKDFNKMVKGENAWDKVWGKGVKGTLSLMTEASELTVRFAEYVTARQMGRSVQEAAKLAKNISVNFNQSGLMSKEMSKFFTFFNATIQGNMRFLMPYGKNKPKFGEKAFKFGAKFAGMAANFALLGLLSTFLQPDNPDDDTWFTEYDRMSNFILFGKVKIPVVHFFRMYYAAGVQAALAAQGRKTWKDAFYTSAGYIHGELVPSSALQLLSLWEYDETTNTLEFNPAKYAQAAAPSVISPLVDVAVNRDFKGSTVYRKKWDNDKKDITTAKRNTPQWAVDVSNTLHRWSGGNPDVPYKGGNTDGWIDIKPNAIEHLAQGYFSGVWESLGHTAGFIWDGAHDADVYKHATNWPFLRDLFRDYSEEKAYNQQYYSVLQKLEKYEKRVNTLSKNEFNAEKQTNRFQTFKQVSKQLRRLPNPYNDEETTVTSEDVNKILQLDIELNRNLFTD